MRKQGRAGSVASHRRWRLKGSPVPALSPYWEAEAPRRSLSPGMRGGDTGKGSRLASPTPSCRFRVPTCTPYPTVNPPSPYASEYLDCQTRLKDLQQAFSVALQEKSALKSSISRPVKAWKEASSGSIPQFAGADRAEIATLSGELEEMYALLSSSHATIGALQEKHRVLAENLHTAQRELGVQRYQSELRASTSEVKGSLVLSTQLEEVLAKRSTDLHSLSLAIRSLRQEKAAFEAAVSNLDLEKQTLAKKVADLQRISSPEVANLAENYRQLALANGKCRLNEEKIRALEEFVKRNRA